MLHRSTTLITSVRFLVVLLLPLVVATAAASAVTLEWDANDPSPDGYRLFRKLDGGEYDYSDPLASIPGTRYVDNTTVTGETYLYVVRAYEGENESGDSNEVSYTAPGDTADDNDGGDSDDHGDSSNDTDAESSDDSNDTVTDQDTPADRIGLTPLLSATMSVDGHQHTATRWQISLNEQFTSLVLDQVSEAQLTRYPVPDMVLDTETVYYWRATYLDASLQTLTQSNTANFETIAAADSDDLDSNGFIDNQEVDATDLDLDRNGISDSQQDDLVCVAAETGEGHLGLKLADDNAQLVGLKSVCPTQIANTRNLPEMTPFGAVSFKLYLPDDQDQATITIYFSEPAPEGTDWFKYNPETGWQLYADAQFSADRRSVSYTLTDGGSGDDDGVDNGIIIDPAGLGYRQATDSDTDTDTTTPSVSAGGSAGGGCFIASTGLSHDDASQAAGLIALLIACAGMGLRRRMAP